MSYQVVFLLGARTQMRKEKYRANIYSDAQVIASEDSPSAWAYRCLRSPEQATNPVSVLDTSYTIRLKYIVSCLMQTDSVVYSKHLRAYDAYGSDSLSMSRNNSKGKALVEDLSARLRKLAVNL